MGDKTNMLVPESLGQKGTEDSLRGVTSVRRKVRKPSTFGMASTESVKGRNVDSESGGIIRDLIEIGD